MIYKSYLVEKKISLLNDGITLIYGENLGLQNNIKKKILAANNEAGIITVNQDEIFNNEEEFLVDYLTYHYLMKENFYNLSGN